MRAIIVFLCTLVAVGSFSVPGLAAQPATFSFSPARAPHPLPLDPSLADNAWKAGLVPGAQWEDLTTRRAAPLQTTVYALYDDTALYVGFDVQQEGLPLTAAQATNDVGFGLDDFVGVGIDTSGSGAQTYFFETTPRGTRYQQASENARYRPAWQSAATIVDAGHWRAVLIVPLSAMRLPSGSQQTWKMNFIRGIAANGEHYTWAYDGVMQDAGAGAWPMPQDVRFWPTANGIALTGRRATLPKPRIEAFAVGAIGNDRGLYQQSDGSFQQERLRSFGVDASVPLTPTINFVGTLAPDFSNVEVDQQSIAPQEFRRQLAEYRPFFAQGANYINVPENPYTNFSSPESSIFYSPTIGPFDRGEKIEGTYGHQSIGVLNFRGYDQVSGNTFDDTAFGFKHALPDRTFAYYAEGVSGHHSLAGNDETFEAGAKGRNLHTGLVWNVDQVIEHGSWDPAGTSRSTYGWVDIHKPFEEVLFAYSDLSPWLNPIDGYAANSDVRGFSGFYNANGSTKWAKSISAFFAADRFFDRSGAVHQADASLFLNATFNNLFSINGIGAALGNLRGYDAVAGNCATGASVGRTYFSGFPCYRNGSNDTFDLAQIPVGYRDGTPTPIDASASWGNFGSNRVHFYTLSTSRPLGRATLGLEYDGSYERNRATGTLDSQFLRRVSLGINTGADSNLTISLRAINGLGGFAPSPGVNFAAAYHARLRHGDIYVNYGTPAANVTLNRLIVKYVFRAGAEAGT